MKELLVNFSFRGRCSVRPSETFCSEVHVADHCTAEKEDGDYPFIPPS
jgi:hypothetical protein